MFRKDVSKPILKEHLRHNVAGTDGVTGTEGVAGTDGKSPLPAGFEMIAPVAEGSFSRICKVRCRETGSFFALKCLRPEWTDELNALKLLETEATAGRNVRSEHVVALHHADTLAKPPYLILEWLEGETLEETLIGTREMPIARTVWIARQAAEGLRALAESGFTHGDVKPANIFLTKSGLVKLIDLGFAQKVDQTSLNRDEKLFVCTAEFLAPEALTGVVFNAVTMDVYSLGVTMFRMLTGRLPFSGGSAAEVLRLHRQAKPPSLRRLCPGIPEELANLVERMLAKQPLRRPQSLSTLVRDLLTLELAALPRRRIA